MRILYVAHRFLPDYLAGTEVYTALLAHGLRERGHTVQVFTGNPSASASAYMWEGIPVQAVPWGPGLFSGPVDTFLAGFINPRVERAFAQFCAAFRPDLIHFQHLLGLSPRLPHLGRRYGARVILTLHDYWFLCSNTWLFRWNRTLCPGPGAGYYCGGCALARLGRTPHAGWMALAAPVFVARTLALRQALRSPHRLTAPSRLTARLYAQHGVPADRLLVLPDIAPDLETRRLARRSDEAQLRFVYVGSLIPPKGVHVAIAAFNRLTHCSAQFHIYGDLTADPGYVAELRRLAQHPGIEFKGSLARAFLPDILGDADVLVFPSVWHETYAIIVDEAFRAGLPVLVSEQSAPAERIVAEQNGLLAPPGAVEAWSRQMLRLIQDPGLLVHLRKNIPPAQDLAQYLSEIERLYVQERGIGKW